MNKKDCQITISNKGDIEESLHYIESSLVEAHDKINKFYEALCINCVETVDNIEAKFRKFIKETVCMHDACPDMKEAELPIWARIDSAKHMMSENKSAEDITQTIYESLSTCSLDYTNTSANTDSVLDTIQKKVDDWNAERFNQIEKSIYDRNFEVYYGRIKMVYGESYLIDAGRVLNKESLWLIRIFKISDYEAPVVTQIFQAAYTSNHDLEDGTPRLLNKILSLINMGDNRFRKLRNMKPKELDLSEYGINDIPYIGKDIKVKYVDRTRKDD